MAMKLSYGNGVCCEVEIDPAVYVGTQEEGSSSAGEVVAMVRNTLRQTQDYPNLTQITMPGDRVVVTVEFGIPRVVYVVEGLLAALADGGVEPSLVTVLLSRDFAEEVSLQKQIRDTMKHPENLLLHNPDEEGQLALLGVDQSGEPIRLNRALCEADVVIPLGGSAYAAERGAVFRGLYPELADGTARARYQKQQNGRPSRRNVQGKPSAAEETAWLLGVTLVIQVVPGPGNTVGKILTGTADEVVANAHETYGEMWSHSISEQADLVIATVVGDSSQQTWHNVGRALLAANRVIKPGGTIAICSELTERPGPPLQRLAEESDLAWLEARLQRNRHQDSWIALALCRALQNGAVYLKCNLKPDAVESLGLTPISSEDELQRLAAAHQSTVVLGEAQRLLIR